MFFKKNTLKNGPDLMDSKRNACLKMFQKIRQKFKTRLILLSIT